MSCEVRVRVKNKQKEQHTTVIDTYFVSIPRLSINLMTSVMHTAVVEKYRSPDEMVLVYRSATVYVAATRVITVRQYSLKTTLTFSEETTCSDNTNEMEITVPDLHVHYNVRL